MPEQDHSVEKGRSAPMPQGSRVQSWPRAVTVSGGISVALWLGLAALPTRLMTFLDEQGVGAKLRDAIVAGVFTGVFVGIAWVLVVLQKKGRI